MEVHADLHAHSIFAGGAGGVSKDGPKSRNRMTKRFQESSTFSPLKGVNLLGTGDCQFGPWNKFLQSELEEVSPGIYEYKQRFEKSIKLNIDLEEPNYLLQTEVIFTGPTPNSKRKKKAHVLIYFPDFTRVAEFNILLEKFKVSHQKMARPFIVNETVEEIEMKIHKILDLDPNVEIIPAHIMTPEGVYGSNDRINYLNEFFGSADSRIHAIETGLSADPWILGLIPELDNRTLISNADAHSAALNRVGREFTSLQINKLDYSNIIKSIRENRVTSTAEFHPAEGRYFLTGHRSERKKPGIHNKHQYCYFSPNHVPVNDLCPICKKELTVGVLQRAFEISKAQTENNSRKLGEGPQREFVTMVPLIEIVSQSLGLKSLTSKTALKTYLKVIEQTGSEANIWTKDINLEIFDFSDTLKTNLSHIKIGNFSFSPLGYDGTYGELVIGKKLDLEDVSVVSY
ncbi:MAG: endonuclease Q family protein [Candidatus Kariarchaeaceae archaeon]|jgi:PHP family Zn ribbon phosphoesterase